MAKRDTSTEKKPNILIIWGDDIGQSNLSCYTKGVMGYRTPNIDRIANEGMIFTDYYGEQSCTAGRAAFITGQSVFRTGLSKVGMPGCHVGHAGRRPDHRRAAQAARLRHRPVRQEPPRRPGRAPADDARLRRVLRQSLPPQCRGGAGAARLSDGERLSRIQEELRPARRAALLGRRQRQAEDREHRPADQEAHGDRATTNSWPRPWTFITEPAQGGQAVLCLVQHHAHALPHPREARKSGPVGALAIRISRRDDRSRQARRRDA